MNRGKLLSVARKRIEEDPKTFHRELAELREHVPKDPHLRYRIPTETFRSFSAFSEDPMRRLEFAEVLGVEALSVYEEVVAEQVEWAFGRLEACVEHIERSRLLTGLRTERELQLGHFVRQLHEQLGMIVWSLEKRGLRPERGVGVAIHGVERPDGT